MFRPVCGCDGNTYPNRCWALKAGQNIAATGECRLAGLGDHCGGFVRNPPRCAPPLVCDLRGHPPDTGGVCVER